MSTATDSTRSADPGLQALVMLLHLQGVAADAGQIRHRLGTNTIGAPEMLRCAKELGLKARAYRTEWSRLVKTPLPAIAALRDGRFMVVAKAGEDKVLVQPPLASRPALMTQAEFLAVWDGELILMTRRAGLADLTRRFDILDGGPGNNTVLQFATVAPMASGNSTDSTVTPADGAQAASLALLGQFMASSFVTAGDGHGGTPLADPASSQQQPLLTQPHA